MKAAEKSEQGAKKHLREGDAALERPRQCFGVHLLEVDELLRRRLLQCLRVRLALKSSVT